MARSFDGSTQYASVSAAAVTATPLTLACWFLPTSVSITQMLLRLSDGTNSNAFQLQAISGGLRATTSAGGTNGIATTSAGPTANVWNHAAGVFASAANRTAYLGGGNSGTNATALTPTGINTTTLARRDDGTLFFGGLVAEVGIWNVALTLQEIQALAAGLPPRFVRPQSLVAYYPLWGLSSPEPDLSGNAHNLTLTNSPPQGNHAPVTFFTRKPRSQVEPAASAPAVLIPRPVICLPPLSPALFE